VTFAADANKWRPLGLKAQQLTRGERKRKAIVQTVTGCVQI